MTKEEIIVDREKKAKAIAMQGLVKSAGWAYVKTWIEEQIAANRDIKKVKDNSETDDRSTLIDLRKRRTKIDVYQGILNYINTCIDQTKEKENA